MVRLFRLAAVSMICAVFWVSFLTPILIVQTVKAELATSTKYGAQYPIRANPKYLDPADSVSRNEDEYDEVLVGIKSSALSVSDIRHEVSQYGNITKEVLAGEVTQALCLRIPSQERSFITSRLLAAKWTRYVEPDVKTDAFFTPNDPYWPRMWGLRKIAADYAWNTTLGSSNILIAVLDTGIDYFHEDIIENYVPFGYNWVEYNSDPIDYNGHGTHCAGIIAATINNSVGVAGLSQGHIMAEKVLDDQGNGYYSWLIQGIYHAVSTGAKIISMSLGGSTDSEALHDAIKYAYAHGALLVAAAGNTGEDLPFYPAAYDEVISISATDSNDELASFSTYGNWVDLCAPGVEVYSALPHNSYGKLSGTSMACAHVSGVAALVWSLFPGYTNNELGRLLKFSADDLGAIGFDPYYGHGRINAGKAVEGLPEHDIAIVGWQHPNRLDPDQTGTFDVTVYNFGRNIENNVEIRFLVDDIIIYSCNLTFLEVAASGSIMFSWRTAISGVHNVTCNVIPVWNEIDISNNVATSTVTIRFATQYHVPSEYSTIKIALGTALEDDTIVVDNGHYYENTIEILMNNITLIGTASTVVDGQMANCVFIIKANYVTLEGFTITGFSLHGIRTEGHGNEILANKFLLNAGPLESCWCIYAYSSTKTRIDNNTLLTGSAGGISMEQCSDCMITKNNIQASGPWLQGLFLSGGSRNTIDSNLIARSSTFAFVLYYSTENLIISNSILDSMYGLIIAASPYNVMRNNSMKNNTVNFGIWLEDMQFSVWQLFNDVDFSNTVDYKPICYWVNERDRAVPTDAGCVVLLNCNNITCENLDLGNNLQEIVLIGSNGTKIENNNFSSKGGDIYFGEQEGITAVGDCSNNRICLNNMTGAKSDIFFRGGSNNCITMNNMHGASIGLYFNDLSIVESNYLIESSIGAAYCTNCVLTSNSINNSYGLGMSGSGFLVDSNIIIGCYSGIGLNQVSQSLIRSNYVMGCEIGINIFSSENNIFYRNDLVANHYQVSGQLGSNIWDNGYPSGGNYWSDYVSFDLNHGPFQNISGRDEMGDTPYVIDANNRDKYPLIRPCNEYSFHSLTISSTLGGQTCPRNGTYVYLSETPVSIVAQPVLGYCFGYWIFDGQKIEEDPLNTIMNDGHTVFAVFIADNSPPDIGVPIQNPPAGNIVHVNESVEVSIAAVDSISGVKNVTLYWTRNGGITWTDVEMSYHSATGVWKAAIMGCTESLIQYKIGAYDHAGNHIINDNNGSWFSYSVKLLPDVNNDGTINLRDVTLFIQAFNTFPTHPRWNPNADLNHDGKIRMDDLVIIIKDFGLHY